MSTIYYDFPGHPSLDDKIAHLRERAEFLSAALRPIDKDYSGHLGGAILEIAKLYSSFAGCMELFARTVPYRAGDRVRLLRAPKCEGGWASSRHFLVAGALATVKSVEIDYLMRDWSLYLEFDDESWIAPFDDYHLKYKRGDVIPTPPEDRHVYGFKPDWVEKVEPPVERGYLEVSG